MNTLGREDTSSGKISRNSLMAEFFSGVFSHLFDLLEGTVENFIRTQQQKILRKASVIVVFLLGAIFLLNSLALFISDYLEKSSWVGYGVVGGVLILLALISRKE